MISNHPQFIDAIRERKLIRVKFYSHPDAATVERECAPLDYGPQPGDAEAMNRYWLWDYADNSNRNPLKLLSTAIVSVAVLGRTFDPTKIVDANHPWFVIRDWSSVAATPPVPAPVAAR